MKERLFCFVMVHENLTETVPLCPACARECFRDPLSKYVAYCLRDGMGQNSGNLFVEMKSLSS